MNTRLRHLKGKSLPDLEKALEKVRTPHIITSINFVKGQWYIHLLLQKADLKSDFSTLEVDKTREASR